MARAPRKDAPTLFDHAAAAGQPVDNPPDSPKPARPPLLLVLDGHAMVFRAFFGIKQPMTIRSTGEEVRGVYGFTNSMFRAIGDYRPTHMAVAFDPPGPTFRDDVYAEYKANRPPAPPELHMQVDRIKQVIEALQIPIYEVSGYEADDVLGTITREATAHGTDTIIFTGDSDMLQLVSPHVRVLITSGFGEQKMYDVQAVRERYGGLEPQQQIDVKALEGDTSDNIPGVPGVGRKTAIKLVQQFDSVEGIYERIDDVSPPRIQQLLRDHEEQAKRNKHLVTIVTEAPVEFAFDQSLFGHYDRNDVLEVFRQLEFNSLIPRIPAPVDEIAQPASDDTAPSSASTQAAPTETVVVDTPEALTAMVKDLRAASVVAFDTETTSIDPMQAALVGLSFAVTPGKAYYVPVGHQTGQQLPLEQVLAHVVPLLEEPSIGKVGHNANFDLTLLANYGVRPGKVKVAFDTLLAAHLLGDKALGLKAQAFNRLMVEMTPISELIGTGRNQITFDQVGIEMAAPYAAADADMTLRLMQVMEPELERDGLTTLMVEHEMPLVSVIAQMQINGIGVDTSVLENLAEELTGQIQTLEAGIYNDLGHRFNINSPAQLADILYNELKLPKGKRTQTGYSTDAATLDALNKMPPEALENTRPESLKIVANIQEYRALTKLKSTYVDALPLAVNPETHRIHTSYNQAGSATGRIASNDPNLQNIPIRTEVGRRVRKAFIAEGRPDWLLVAADYSQVELRVLAHLSQDRDLIAAFERNEDIHAATAARIYKVSLDEVTRDMRRLAKVMNFGVIYGLSAFGISQQTELTNEEGAEFIKTYFSTYPKVREYIDATIDAAKRDGYVETLLGRRRYLPELRAPNQQARMAGERMAINMPVQGTAAEVLREALMHVQCRLDETGMRSKMLLQVHDELVFESPKEEVDQLKEMLEELMPHALELVVPLRIEIKTGETWGNME
jgi:DNA polymerase-1